MKYWKFVWAFILLINPKNVEARDEHQKNNQEQFDYRFTYNNGRKTLDTAMLAPAHIAIQHYPELKDTRIEFKYKKIPTLMAARPKLFSLFGKKENRKYVLIISTNLNNHSKKIFQNMSLTSKIGILGHEYAHILDYEQKTKFGLLKYGINYLFNKKEIERKTDNIAITRGLGNEMLEYNMYLKSCNLTSKKYMAKKKKYYLSVAEIREILSSHRDKSQVIPALIQPTQQFVVGQSM